MSNNGKKPNYDTTFLDNDTEFRAYFLGLFMADGWMEKKAGRLYISLADKQLMDELVERTQYRNKMSEITTDTPYGSQHMYRLSFSFNLKDKMKEFGFTSEKTGNEFVPECINEDNFKHFLRGFFDGDGSISITKSTGYLEGSFISASKPLLEYILTYLKKHSIIAATNAHINKRGDKIKPIYRLRFSHNDIIDLCEYMYHNETIKLERKFNVYKEGKLADVSRGWQWKANEIDMLKQGIVPPNRTNSSCHSKARLLGFKFRKANKMTGRGRKVNVVEPITLQTNDTPAHK